MPTFIFSLIHRMHYLKRGMEDTDLTVPKGKEWNPNIQVIRLLQLQDFTS